MDQQPVSEIVYCGCLWVFNGARRYTKPDGPVQGDEGWARVIARHSRFVLPVCQVASKLSAVNQLRPLVTGS